MEHPEIYVLRETFIKNNVYAACRHANWYAACRHVIACVITMPIGSMHGQPWLVMPAMANHCGHGPMGGLEFWP